MKLLKLLPLLLIMSCATTTSTKTIEKRGNKNVEEHLFLLNDRQLEITTYVKLS